MFCPLFLFCPSFPLVFLCFSLPYIKNEGAKIDYSIFELNVALTVELYLQIQYYGSNIEVLEPEDLRDTIAGEVHRMALTHRG